VSIRGGIGWALGLTFVAQVILQLQGLILLPIVIPRMGEAAYGAYVLVIISLSQVFELTTNGISYSYSRKVVSAPTAGERRRLFEPQFTVQIIVFAVFSAALLAAGPTIGVEGNIVVTAWLLVGVLAANLLSGQVRNYYRNTLRFLPYNLVLGGVPSLFIAMLLIGLVVGHAPTVDTLLALQAAAGIGLSLPFFWRMVREIGVPRFHLQPRVVAADFRAGLPVTIGMIINFTLSFGDRYLILLFLSVADVGRYQPAYQLASVVLFLPRIIGMILTPLLARMVDFGHRAESEHLVATAMRLFIMVAVPFAVGMTMVGPSLLGALTRVDVGVAGRWVLPIVAAAAMFYGLTMLMGSIGIALNRLSMLLRADALGMALNLGFNLALLPLLHEITVAAATTLLGYVASAAYYFYLLREHWRFHVEWGALLRFAAAAGIMGAALRAMGYRAGTVTAISVFPLLGGIAAAVIIYFVALIALGGLGRRERQQIASLMRSRAPETEKNLMTDRHTIRTPALIIATEPWPSTAMLADTLHQSGFAVAAVCWEDNPLRHTSAVERCFPYSAWSPWRSIEKAIALYSPALLVPADDEAAYNLYELHRKCRKASGTAAAMTASLIETSLGDPNSFPIARRKSALMRLAQECGVNVPETLELESEDDLARYSARNRFPFVLKQDEMFGGRGVVIVGNNLEAAAAYRKMRARSNTNRIRELVRSSRTVLAVLRAPAAAITAQRHVEGRPANRAVACWKGRVLAGTTVLAVEVSSPPTGHATVVEFITNAEIDQTVERLVAKLGLSGFCGFDFILGADGRAYLLELNPRATSACWVGAGLENDLCGALFAAVTGNGQPDDRHAAPLQANAPQSVGRVALFPQEWIRCPTSPHLHSSYHRVPWHDPRLVAYLIADAMGQREFKPSFVRRLARRILLGKAE
jgi:O-antigen/teichoic acid export membrane protein